jgi:hypothetical protein
MLRSSGFNIIGLTLDASVAVYKTIVRLMVECCLALTPKSTLKTIQRAQEHGLRTKFSSTRHTSRAALQLLTRISPIRDRQLLLQASFFGKLHNSNDANNPAVQLYWRALHASSPKKSCVNEYLDNTAFQKVIPKRNHLVDRLVKEKPTIDDREGKRVYEN